MNRILACVASDFTGKDTSLVIKNAILNAEGRTIIADISAETTPLYSEVTSGELVAAFGGDLLLLKGIDVKNTKISGLETLENPIERLRELTGLGIGVNLEIADQGPEFKRLNTDSLAALLNLNADFLSLTGYRKPEVTPSRIKADVEKIRSVYPGFLMLNPVVTHGSQLNQNDLLSYVKAGADLIVLPAPGSVPGVTEELLASMTNAIREAGALVSATVGTSQEGADEATIRELTLSAKRAGVDVFELGDAGVAGTASIENIFTASLALRGKRHTYVRMARSANR